MDRQFFVELTNDLYRLTILFPKEEPIRIKIRGLADDILTELITILNGSSIEKRETAKKVERNIGILESMLEIAEGQKWVKENEFEEIRESYSSIRKEIEQFNKLQKEEKVEERPLKKERKSSGKKRISALNKRQKNILEMLEKSDKVQVQDAIDNLEDEVTKRTIRRDFKKLIKLDFAKKKGKANMTHYRLKE